MATEEGAVYCTLLLSDNYLPGAVVLAHSLRDNGTKVKLVVLYTPDSLQPATIQELQTVYDELIPVHPTTNSTPANLWLMDRPDLIATFTKIELWKQTQYKRIVYIDCDVVAVRAPDELLTLEVDFAAAPDVGWPDCFNSGLMVLRPNMQDYYALKALAERGISFDGADQGLLNMHFRDWHRLSFTYNCTPSANYQYIPAYKHFQSTISLVHFIGAQKPWNMPRQVSPAESPYNQLLGRWWAIYDKHYRPVASVLPSQWNDTSGVSQLDIKDSHEVMTTESLPTHHSSGLSPEDHPSIHHQTSLPARSMSEVVDQTALQFPQGQTRQDTQPISVEPSAERTWSQKEQPDFSGSQTLMRSVVPQYVRGEEYISTYIRPHSDEPPVSLHIEQPPWAENPVLVVPPKPLDSSDSQVPQQQVESVPGTGEHLPLPSADLQTFEAPRTEWDPAREPPPLNTKPEGIALEKKTYTMSEDKELFKPPAFYPEAPKNMYYEVPSSKPEPGNLSQIFPWESHAPKPTRVFLDDEQSSVSLPSSMTSAETLKEPYTRSMGSMTPWASQGPSESFESYSRSNAWDDVPEIQRYIQSIQRFRKARVQVVGGASDPTDQGQSDPEGRILLTNFPSEQERPSLPVTPAPVRKPPPSSVQGEDTSEQLPIAEGVPNQDEWNPLVRLEELRRRQSEVLENPDILHERIERMAIERGRRGR